MILVNLAQDKSKINNYLSNTLLKQIEENIKQNKKTILYLNKRWEYASLICEKCNYIYKCEHCDISLSVNKYPENLSCNLCWKTQAIPYKCKKCGSNNLIKVWVWTQQIEQAINSYFNNKIAIFRFDSDNVKNKSQKLEAMEKLEQAQIIIWTKMITTGFDFKNIWLIWVILIEQELQIPKYNTEEKVYSNIKQLLWRWERVWEKTEFIIQTFIPENEIIQNIINKNYKDFFMQTLEERKIFKYPPFVELLTLEYRNKSEEKAKNFILNLKNKLDLELKNYEKNEEISEILLNPNYQKKYNQYYYRIIIKWTNLRNFIECVKGEIFRNKELVVIFG